MKKNASMPEWPAPWTFLRRWYRKHCEPGSVAPLWGCYGLMFVWMLWAEIMTLSNAIADGAECEFDPCRLMYFPVGTRMRVLFGFSRPEGVEAD